MTIKWNSAWDYSLIHKTEKKHSLATAKLSMKLIASDVSLIRMFAVGFDDCIYSSLNGGLDWNGTKFTRCFTRPPDGYENEWVSISCDRNCQYIAAATEGSSLGGGLYTSNNYGEYWNYTSYNKLSSPPVRLVSLSQDVKQMLLAFSSSLLVSTDFGQTWSIAKPVETIRSSQSSIFADCSQISFLNNQMVFGIFGGNISFSKDDGFTWNEVNVIPKNAHHRVISFAVDDSMKHIYLRYTDGSFYNCEYNNYNSNSSSFTINCMNHNKEVQRLIQNQAQQAVSYELYLPIICDSTGQYVLFIRKTNTWTNLNNQITKMEYGSVYISTNFGHSFHPSHLPPIPIDVWNSDFIGTQYAFSSNYTGEKYVKNRSFPSWESILMINRNNNKLILFSSPFIYTGQIVVNNDERKHNYTM